MAITDRIRLRARILSHAKDTSSLLTASVISFLDILILRPFKLRRSWRESARILVRFRELTFRADPHLLSIYGEIFVRGVYFKDLNFLPAAGMTVLDVGANEGFFTVYCARQGCKVVAVEPNPISVGMLRQHCSLNAIRDVQIIPCALGAGNGMVDFVQCFGGGGASGSSHVTHGEIAVHNPRIEITKVEEITLDRLSTQLGIVGVDLLKIDVEGSELEVVRGGEQTLRKLTRRVVVECEPVLEDQLRSSMEGAGLKQVDKFHSVLYFASHGVM